MYCKNCGRQLKEGMRFCDRCGQSVRKNTQSVKSTKRQEIEELKAERLNRKRRLEEKERKQALKKKRRKKKGNVFLFVIILLLAAALSMIIGYKMMSDDNTAGSTASQSSTTTAPLSSSAPSSDKNGYTSVTVGNVTCPYPSTFRSNATTGSEKLNLTDTLGGATMTVKQEGKSGQPKDLMLAYLDEIGGKATYSHAGSEWYAITVNSADKVYHRKCILRNGIAVYYDFIYDAASSAAQKYNEYIEYIDSKFE